MTQHHHKYKCKNCGREEWDEFFIHYLVFARLPNEDGWVCPCGSTDIEQLPVIYSFWLDGFHDIRKQEEYRVVEELKKLFNEESNKNWEGFIEQVFRDGFEKAWKGDKIEGWRAAKKTFEKYKKGVMKLCTYHRCGDRRLF